MSLVNRAGGSEVMSKWYEAKVSACAHVAFVEMMKDSGATPLYVWFCRGDLIVSPNQPPGMEIATPVRIPSKRDQAGIRSWIWDACRRVPCLP